MKLTKRGGLGIILWKPRGFSAIFAKEIERGISMGIFDIDNVALTTDIIHGCARGLEVPYIYGRVGKGMNINISRPIVRKLIYKALRKEDAI